METKWPKISKFNIALKGKHCFNLQSLPLNAVQQTSLGLLCVTSELTSIYFHCCKGLIDEMSQ